MEKTAKPKAVNTRWDYKGDYREGLAFVKDKNGKYGFVDKTGNLVIPCQWEWAGGFKNGKARVGDNNGKAFYIDKTGKKVK